MDPDSLSLIAQSNTLHFLTRQSLKHSSALLKHWNRLQTASFLKARDAKQMKHSKPPITVSTSKTINITEATLSPKKLLDPRTKQERYKPKLEAFIVNEPANNGHEELYSQTIDCDYVI